MINRAFITDEEGLKKMMEQTTDSGKERRKMAEKFKKRNVDLLTDNYYVFNNELKLIQNDKIREFCKTALTLLPEYFYHIAASSTGKYHPPYALGEGGLVRHTKAAVRFANHILDLQQFKQQFNSDDRDLIICALLLHDGKKHGDGGNKFTVFEHPLICAKWILECDDLDNIISDNQRHIIADCISSHMGEWNTSNRSQTVLALPITKYQKIVHLCDYLASRKDIIVTFETEGLE